jgi:hypothetical protein
MQPIIPRGDASPIAELPLNIDSTMISAFRQCPRKFHTEFCLGLRPAAMSIDLHAGGCFASAMENVYHFFYQEGLPLDKALVRAFGRFMDQWGDFVSMKDTPKTRERVWEAVEHYFAQWSPMTDPIQPFSLEGKGTFEFTFAIPLEPSDTLEGGGFPLHPSGSPFMYSGRFDLLGLWQGRPIVRDEKTTTSIGQRWAGQWDLRSQFMGYVWACQQSGIPVETVCVRGIGILKTKIDLVEAYKTYSKVKVARWHEQLRRDLWRLRHAWDENYFDYNFADACASYGGCSFVDLCGSEHPERWYSQFVQRRWNPVLKNPIEPSTPAEVSS